MIDNDLKIISDAIAADEAAMQSLTRRERNALRIYERQVSFEIDKLRQRHIYTPERENRIVERLSRHPIYGEGFKVLLRQTDLTEINFRRLQSNKFQL